MAPIQYHIHLAQGRTMIQFIIITHPHAIPYSGININTNQTPPATLSTRHFYSRQ